jgi:hypothetical protein
MIYFTSDTHFGESRVLRIDRRPFANMVEHDAADASIGRLSPHPLKILTAAYITEKRSHATTEAPGPTTELATDPCGE